MAIIRLKRRANGGASGAPSALKTSEPAFNETDNTLYLGFGDDGSGNATSIVTVGGKGAFADLSSNQTIGGTKTFSVSPVAPTPTAGDNSTKVATTAYVTNAVGSVGAGAMIYQGAWNASTNSPSLASATGTKGHFYKVSAAGSTALDGISDWKVGDMVAYNGSAWDKFDNTDQVTSVNSQSGAVVLTKSDVGLGNVSNLAPADLGISTATQSALNGKEPTITAGTTSQYLRGDKSLATLNTVAVVESTNLYYTDARVGTYLGTAIIDGGVF